MVKKCVIECPCEYGICDECPVMKGGEDDE